MAQSLGQGMGAIDEPSNGTNRGGNYPPIVPGPQTSAPRVPAGKMVLTDARAEDIVAPLPTSTPAKPVTDESPYQLPSTEDAASLDALGVKPYFSNSKAFSLDYDLEAHPAIGIQSIELWGTTDGGKTWDLWGSDPDRASPMDISVEDEGRFGFRIAIVSAVDNPRTGRLRATPPICGFRSIRPCLWPRSPRLNTARVEKLVRLFWTIRPRTNSWRSARSHSAFGHAKRTLGHDGNGIANSGRYVWSVEPNLPKKVYIRMEVMDQAGNVSVHVPSAPIDIQGLTPRGRNQGIRPIRNP